MNSWFVIFVNIKKRKHSKYWKFETYPEAVLHFHKKVPVVLKNGTNLDMIMLSSAWFSHSGYFIIDSKRCDTEWLIDYIRPLMVEERNKVIDSLLDE